MDSGSELESFMCKFKHLVDAGYKAKMCFNSSEGSVHVSLDVELGILTPLSPQNICLRSPRSRGPSYYRRQERRREARNTNIPQNSEENAVQANFENFNGSVKEVVTRVKAEKAVTKDGDSKASPQDVKVVDENCRVEEFMCNECNFKSNWKNALQVHRNKIHSAEDNDIQIKEDENEFAQNYWSTGKL